MRIDAVNNQMGYSVGKGLCLSGSCPGNHQQRATLKCPLFRGAVFDRPALFLV